MSDLHVEAVAKSAYLDFCIINKKTISHRFPKCLKRWNSETTPVLVFISKKS